MLYSHEELKKATGPLMLALAYAGHATTGNYSGGAHLIVTSDMTRGRLVRQAGDALCKPAARFWGLEPEPERSLKTVSCKRCKEIAERLGLLADPQDGRRQLLRVFMARIVELNLRPVEVDFYTKNSHYRVNLKEQTVERLSPRPFPPRKVAYGLDVFSKGPALPEVGLCYFAVWAEPKEHQQYLHTTRVVSMLPRSKET